MELLQFIQTQTYYFPHSQQQLLQILQQVQNQALLYSIKQNQQIIQYYFNLQEWINLSDLIYYYRQKFFFIRFWQFLKIIKKLILYYEEMNNQQISVQFITEDRIWINIKQGSNSFTIEREKVEFQIVIVGHGCPIFERGEFQPKDDRQSITTIIKNLFQLLQHTFREYQEKSEILQQLQSMNSLSEMNSKIRLILSQNKQRQYKKLLTSNRKSRWENLRSNLNQLWYDNNCCFCNFRFIKMKFIFSLALHSLVEGLDYYPFYIKARVDSQKIQEFDELVDAALKFQFGQKKMLEIVNQKINQLNQSLNESTKISFSMQIDELYKIIIELECEDLKLYSFNSLKQFQTDLKVMLTNYIEFKIQLLFNQFVEKTIQDISNSLF